MRASNQLGVAHGESREKRRPTLQGILSYGPMSSTNNDDSDGRGDDDAGERDVRSPPPKRRGGAGGAKAPARKEHAKLKERPPPSPSLCVVHGVDTYRRTDPLRDHHRVLFATLIGEWSPLYAVEGVRITCGVISAVVVVVAAVADSAVSWHFRWPGGPWRPLLGLSEYAQPRWCY